MYFITGVECFDTHRLKKINIIHTSSARYKFTNVFTFVRFYVFILLLVRTNDIPEGFDL